MDDAGTALEMVVDGWSWRNVRQSLILQPPEDAMELLAKSGCGFFFFVLPLFIDIASQRSFVYLVDCTARGPRVVLCCGGKTELSTVTGGSGGEGENRILEQERSPWMFECR